MTCLYNALHIVLLHKSLAVLVPNLWKTFSRFCHKEMLMYYLSVNRSISEFDQ